MMDDGVVLRADVFRPLTDGRFPVILSYGPYAKGLAFQEGYKSAWTRMTAAYPETAAGSSNKYQNWELVDPEKWVPDGYAIVRIDSRGAGRSPGYLEVWSPRETSDLYDCVEWAGTPALVERQGRSQRHLLLRHEPVARGAAAAAASRRALHLGRLVRLLPRARAPRRHPLRLSAQLVAPASRQRPARRGRARAEEPGHRRVGSRSADAVGAGARRQAGRCRRRSFAAPADRRLLPRAHARLRRNRRAAACRRRTGAATGCIRAATSKAISPPARSRSGWRCTATRTSRTSTPTMASACKNASSATSSRARTPAGSSSQKLRSTSGGRARTSRYAPRMNGRWPAPAGPRSISTRPTADCAATRRRRPPRLHTQRRAMASPFSRLP